MVLTNQLIYLVNVKTMRKIFSNYVCFTEKATKNCEIFLMVWTFTKVFGKFWTPKGHSEIN